MEVNIGQKDRSAVVSSSVLAKVCRTHLHGTQLVTVAVHNILIGRREGFLQCLKALLGLSVCGDVVLDGRSLPTGQFGQHHLGEPEDNENLEGEGLHGGVERSSEDGVGIGLFLGQFDNVDHGGNGTLGLDDRSVVESVRHDGGG